MNNKSYFDTYDQSLCCGCRVCEQSCKSNAITMVSNEEGFIYPRINKNLCVDCGICKNVCPITNSKKENHIRKIYQLQNKDEVLLNDSSSGGVFINIAKYILKNGGIVFGTILDKNYDAIIISTDNENDLEKMQGSKYVFSNTQDTYSKAKKYLDNDKFVLFTGTPCQIAGLSAFLRKDYKKLITMDFLCHGVPSPKIFKENVNFLSKKYGGNIKHYKFRDKELKGWGHVTSFYINGKKYYESGNLNAYFYGFIKGYLNRYSCYKCPFSGENKYSDITVGDFWGCSSKNLNMRKGVSFAALNTSKGEYIFNKIKTTFLYKETTTEVVSKQNNSLLDQKNEKIPKIRKTIYEQLNCDNYSNIVKKHLTPSKKFILKVKMELDIILKKLLIRK